MKANNVPVSFMSGFNKHVSLMVSCDNWGELSLKKVTIGEAVYGRKFLTAQRCSTILRYAASFVDIDAAIVGYEYDRKNGSI